MATEREARALLRALAEEDVPAEDPALAERRRRRVVESTSLAIARAANEAARRRQRARAIGALAAAAVMLAAVGAAWRIRSTPRTPTTAPTGAVAQGESLVGSLQRSHEGAPLAPISGHLPLGAGDELATETGGRGEVVLADGVAITMESETRVRLPDTSAPAQGREEVSLATGTVSVHVPPMAPGHTFSIKTPDAEVTVHGTSFVVQVRGGGATTTRPATRVTVTSGVVSVSSSGHDATLTAGMEWTSPTEPTALSAPAPRPVSTTAASPSAAEHGPDHGRVASQRAAHQTSPIDATPKSSLGEENQLLSSAIAASKAGQYAGAVGMLDDLLRRFPGSPLAQEAHVERFRALSGAGDSPAAAREARLYLALYPDGFAREEAKALAVGW